MILRIPIIRGANDTSFFKLNVTLENVSYTLEFRWNERDSFWYMSVLNSDATLIYLAGHRLVADWGIGRSHVDRTPPGLFVLRDTARPIGTGEEAGFDDFGNRHQLYYVPFADIA